MSNEEWWSHELSQCHFIPFSQRNKWENDVKEYDNGLTVVMSPFGDTEE